jgi:hypothetical protein
LLFFSGEDKRGVYLPVGVLSIEGSNDPNIISKNKMLFVFYFFMGELRYQLYAADGFYSMGKIFQQSVTDGIAFEQPQKIQIPEFRKQILPVKMIAVKIVHQGIVGLGKFVYGEEVLSLFFGQLYFDLIVDAKVKAEAVVELPAELVPSYRSDNAKQPDVLEKVAG